MRTSLNVLSDATSSCRLCVIVNASANDVDAKLYDASFYETSSFIVIPALGPLCIGHSMIVSKIHFASLLSMEKSVRDEFENICLTLSEHWPDDNIMFAEHGASCSDWTGPCIAHTHMNMIPGVSKDILDLSKNGFSVIEEGNLGSMPNLSETYFLIGDTSSWVLYDASSASPQYIRQVLYKYFGLQEWNWRLHPNEEGAIETFRRWQNLFGE